ncbi:shikimate kinase [Falsibacillus pallidus]|uniref:Shikimate kinase n=1 Tax=Falsibacillus pallidus TaxID=493781 RepID=A0A370GBT7_9BACI|nr:shikimate kinase [Falsibacillus pallidus]RDI41167.1 shikimate kinase [Falsibacillus pallidus]
MNTKIIYLVGYMGAGKTTVGERLANLLGETVYDTDKMIIEKEGCSIQDIFSRYGEEHFRHLETEILKETSMLKGVITTGGGMVLKEENRELMKSSGTVIFLECNPMVIFSRIKGDAERPLLQNKNEIEFSSLYEKRKPYYEKSAHIIIDTSNSSIDEVVSEIEKRLNRR